MVLDLGLASRRIGKSVLETSRSLASADQGIGSLSEQQRQIKALRHQREQREFSGCCSWISVSLRISPEHLKHLRQTVERLGALSSTPEEARVKSR